MRTVDSYFNELHGSCQRIEICTSTSPDGWWAAPCYPWSLPRHAMLFSWRHAANSCSSSSIIIISVFSAVVRTYDQGSERRHFGIPNSSVNHNAERMNDMRNTQMLNTISFCRTTDSDDHLIITYAALRHFSRGYCFDRRVCVCVCVCVCLFVC